MDAIAEWSAAQQRVIDITAGLDEQQAATTVPACPDWTVRDLLSHMVGVGASILAGDEPDDHNDSWTQAHVDARRDRGIDELVAEWTALADDLRAWMAAHDPRPMGDVIIHEQDLRGALGVSGAQDTDGIRAVRDHVAGGFRAALDGLPPITLRGGAWTLTHGDGDDGRTVVEAGEFDLARALVSRRSAAQLRAWTTVGDIEPFLGAFASLGPLPGADLSE